MRPPHKPDPEDWRSRLHIVTVIFNPERFASRYQLYEEFAAHVESLGGILYTVEVGFGDRPFVVTDASNPRHIQVRTGGYGRLGSEIWIKENALNLGIARIPEEVQYIAWIDADVRFHRHDVFSETIHQLNHFQWVQMFAKCMDTDHEGNPIGKILPSFCYNWFHNSTNMDFSNKLYASGANGHTGYAWACRRQSLSDCGGLIDWAILGSADRHMAYALVDQVEASYNVDIHPEYKKMCKIWAVRARHYVQRNIGYVPGLLTHNWHGGKNRRGYSSRWSILVSEQFNPELDLKKNSMGLYELTERNWRLRDKIRRYFRSRCEDHLYLPGDQ